MKKVALILQLRTNLLNLYPKFRKMNKKCFYGLCIAINQLSRSGSDRTEHKVSNMPDPLKGEPRKGMNVFGSASQSKSSCILAGKK